MACIRNSVVGLHILRPGRVVASVLLISILNCKAFAASNVRVHQVVAGETLFFIAKSHGVSYRYLACLNDIADPSRISIGQQIELPQSFHADLSIGLNWPIERGLLTSPFGPRRANCHLGVDIAAPRGTPIRAAGNGKVVFSGVQNGYGKVVIIQHAKSYRTLYAHLQKSYVKVDQKVTAKQRIASVGSNGRSTGPHLHFEIMVDHKVSDPMFFLPRETRVVITPKVLLRAGTGGK